MVEYEDVECDPFLSSNLQAVCGVGCLCLSWLRYNDDRWSPLSPLGRNNLLLSRSNTGVGIMNVWMRTGETGTNSADHCEVVAGFMDCQLRRHFALCCLGNQHSPKTLHLFARARNSWPGFREQYTIPTTSFNLFASANNQVLESGPHPLVFVC